MEAWKELTDQEKQDLILEAKAGNQDATNTVIKVYIRFACAVARRYRPIAEANGAVDLEDLYQLAALGILLAIGVFDPEKASFLSFVKFIVINLCRRALGLAGRIRKEWYMTTSIDAPIDADDPDGSTLKDLLPDPEALDPAEAFQEKAAKEDNSFSPGVDAAISRLTERKQDIIRRHFQERVPYKDLANEYGTCLQAVSSAQKEAFKILRRDSRIKDAAKHDYCLHVGVNAFQRTGMSSVEILADEDLERQGYYWEVIGRKYWQYIHEQPTAI